MTAPLCIVGIDPGLGSGGLVAVDAADGDRVLLSRSLVPKKASLNEASEEARVLVASFGEPGWGDLEYLRADLRALRWVEFVLSVLDEVERDFAPPVAIAIESFVDQPSRAKKLIRNRWQTPHVIGILTAALRLRGYAPENGRVVYQNAGVVLTQLSTEIATLDARKKPFTDGVVVQGDSLVGNEHETRALAHALALAHRLTASQARELLARLISFVERTANPTNIPVAT